MRWGWVNCLACNSPEGARKAGAVYRHLNLTQVQIAQRAQMASSKMAHQPKEQASRQAGTLHVPSVDAGKLTELLEQNKQLNARIDEMLKQNAELTQTMSRMAMQVGALLEDNAKLRAATEKPVTA